MNPYINLNNTDMSIKIGNLDISISQITYGVFKESFPRHSHGANYYEFHLVCDGKGQLLVNNNAYNLSAKSLFVTGPKIVHEQLTDPYQKMSEYCIGAIVKQKKEIRSSELTDLLINTNFWIGVDDNSKILNYFESIAYESQIRQVGSKTCIDSLLKMIFCYFARHYCNNKVEDNISHFIPDNKRMIIIDNLFLSRYDTLTEVELCKEVNLSRRQLQRFLKKYYGKTFLEIRQTTRLNKADMLINQGYSISEVADLVGYSDINYFRKIKNQAKNT